MEENAISVLKISLDRINSKLDTVEEMISKLEDIAIEFIQNETQRGKWQEQQMNRPSVTYGTISDGLTSV